MNGLVVIKEAFDLFNSSHDPLHGEIRYCAGKAPKPVVVICHSFMAFKDWGFFPYVAEQLAEAGFLSVTFNFSHNGVTGDGNRITDFSKFERNTYSKELEDLDVVVKSLHRREIGAGVSDPSKVYLLGHSRGGGVAIVYSVVSSLIHGLVTWSAISNFDRWTHHQKEKWEESGFLPLAKDTTVSPLRLGISLLQDLESHRNKLDILQAASQVNVPWLILHGGADVTVPSREAERLYQASGKSITELHILEKVGHLYNAASREEEQYATLDKIINTTSMWIQRQSKKE